MSDKETPVLAVNSLSKSFGSLEVLKNISLEAKQGEVVSIIGSSGSGKSTFLRCLNFLESPNKGEIRLNGELLQTELKRNGELVPQNKKQTVLPDKHIAVIRCMTDTAAPAPTPPLHNKDET